MFGFDDFSHWNGHYIDWGSVPAWIGSVLTSASVLLALYIILRDKRAERREQASRVTFVSSLTYGHNARHRARVVIYVYNHSEAAIYTPWLLIRPRRKAEHLRKPQVLAAKTADWKYPEPVVVAPKERAIVKFDIDDHDDDLKVFAFFYDGSAVMWRRDTKQRLRKARRSERNMRLYPPDEEVVVVGMAQ